MYPIGISVWRYHKKDTWFRDLVSRAIVYFTGYNFTHVGVYMCGRHYESAVWNVPGKIFPRHGVRVSLGWPDDPIPDFCMVPEREVTDEEIAEISEVLHTFTRKARAYNFLKLIVLMIVWPTRSLWNKLGWIPFNAEWYGEVCSGFVDEVFREAGWDLFPGEHEGYTVPGQFAKIRGWKRVELSDVHPITAPPWIIATESSHHPLFSHLLLLFLLLRSKEYLNRLWM